MQYNVFAIFQLSCDGRKSFKTDLWNTIFWGAIVITNRFLKPLRSCLPEDSMVVQRGSFFKNSLLDDRLF